jgi:hypothetical protein
LDAGHRAEEADAHLSIGHQLARANIQNCGSGASSWLLHDLEAPSVQFLHYHSGQMRAFLSDCIAHVLKTIPQKKVAQDKVRLPKRTDKGRYNDQASLRGMNFVAAHY